MKRLLILLLCLSLLTGCTAKVTPSVSSVTLPPAYVPYDTPHGTEGMTYTATVPLYLPSTDGRSLLTEYTQLTLDRTRHSAAAIAEALLSYPANDRVRSLGAGTALALYGRDPVEVAGSVCTVNLASSALQLEHNDFYTVCLALAATLSRLDDISYVNVLVCDQPVGLDIAGYLPAGATASRTGEELTTLWELMDARRTPLGEQAADTPLTSTATLYFPLADGSGIMPETRNLSFSGQTPSRLAYGLLYAMSAGAQYLDGICTMPDLTTLLSQDPMTSELADGSRLITLHFTADLESRLVLMGIEPMCFAAAVVCTLTTYIPSVSAVCIISGSTMMTNLYSRTLGTLSFRNGNQKRSQYIHLLREQATVYLAQDGLLKPVSRTLAAGEAKDPAALLELMSTGPTEAELQRGISAVMPVGLTALDVLGMSINDETLLINLSERCGVELRRQSMNEQLACYGMVSTFCRAMGLKRIRFWFASDAAETLGGSFYWGGEFLLNPTMISGS